MPPTWKRRDVGVPINTRPHEIFKGMISRCEKAMPHTVNRCKFSACLVARLDGSVVCAKKRCSPETIFVRKLTVPPR
jgi:hypothetical protein